MCFIGKGKSDHCSAFGSKKKLASQTHIPYEEQ